MKIKNLFGLALVLVMMAGCLPAEWCVEDKGVLVRAPAEVTEHFEGDVTIAGNFTSAGLIDSGGVADAIVLDDDGDTTASAPTDDQIDIELGGADIFTLKDWGTTVVTTDTTEYLFEIIDTTNVITAGTVSLAALNIDLAIGDSTAGTNSIYGILIDGISQDAQNTETAISVASGWDVDLDLAGDIDVDGTANLDVVDIDDTLSVAGNATLAALFIQSTTTVTVTDGLTITPTTSLQIWDAAGAVTITLAACSNNGQLLYTYGNDAQTITIADTNVLTTDGNAATLGQYDIIEWMCIGTKWVHIAKSANS